MNLPTRASKLRNQGRVTVGVWGIDFAEGDYLVAAALASQKKPSPRRDTTDSKNSQRNGLSDIRLGRTSRNAPDAKFVDLTRTERLISFAPVISHEEEAQVKSGAPPVLDDARALFAELHIYAKLEKQSVNQSKSTRRNCLGKTRFTEGQSEQYGI